VPALEQLILPGSYRQDGQTKGYRAPRMCWHWSTRFGSGTAGHSQRSIARDLKIDRRKVKRIIGQPAEA